MAAEYLIRSERRETYVLSGRVTTTTSGTIGSQTSTAKSGFTATRTGAGTYSLALTRRAAELIYADAKVLSSAYTVATKGITSRITVNSTSAATPLLVFQFTRADGTAADVEDAAVVLFHIELAAEA